jgi:glutaredoxin
MEIKIDFDEPTEQNFTIYSKSGCENCKKVKKILTDKNFVYIEINCDDYIIDDKENFLLFIKEKTHSDCNVFPMVFYNGSYIGGYKETSLFCDKLNVSFESDLNF